MICPACRQERAAGDFLPGAVLPEGAAAAVAQKHPHWSRQEVVCRVCANEGKADYLQGRLEAAMGPLSADEMTVVESIRQEMPLATNENVLAEKRLHWNERVADRVAAVVGSWYFSGGIILFLVSWIGANVLWRPFEPYPVIILAVISAVLGSLAAIQGPIILMSQRRQLKRDRLRADNDYQVNLKAELEIEYLHEKLDRLAAYQQARSGDRPERLNS
ncbi:MAG: DUF1003 domain-containing protein [Chloroflexi bacterium]|nr:DUF1003 domain-containing protein [Chloroflexota bacterium]MCI0579519.1 DUF1003 domain-containing protein [Chloroflexota bacterium]MCI0644442.1 DUF1003 domain-containing protein [Chloroflexota bacterium]MCI0725394.1 DUF1003 domain-containing protein [Chloroflexota bacterium]